MEKLWPNFTFVETYLPNQTSYDNLELVQKSRSVKLDRNCLQEWIAVSNNNHQEYSDKDIIYIIQDKDNPGKSEDDILTDLVSQLMPLNWPMFHSMLRLL